MKTIGAIIGEDGRPREPVSETEAVKLAILSELARQQIDRGESPLITPDCDGCGIVVHVDIDALLDAIQGALTQ